MQQYWGSVSTAINEKKKSLSSTHARLHTHTYLPGSSSQLESFPPQRSPEGQRVSVAFCRAKLPLISAEERQTSPRWILTDARRHAQLTWGTRPHVPHHHPNKAAIISVFSTLVFSWPWSPDRKLRLSDCFLFCGIVRTTFALPLSDPMCTWGMLLRSVGKPTYTPP